jgi:predicted type IV restriction endonuclease
MSLREDILDVRGKLKAGRYVNEAAVSQGIVRRLLDSLSWPVYETDIVAPEYSLGGRRVDYALCHRPGKARVLVEVKQVGHGVGAERQLFEYAFHQGIQMAVLTDGQEWHFFLPAGEGDYSERRVFRLNLLNDDIDVIETRLKRYLYHDAVRSGKAIEVAQKDYRDLADRRQIRTTLPEAWRKLVEAEDDLLIELLADKVRDLCGIKPDPDTTAAFLLDQVNAKQSKKDLSDAQQASIVREPQRTVRSRKTTQQSPGTLGFTLYGRSYPARNGADVMVRIFSKLAENDPAFLERFATMPKTTRQKRPYVARTPEDLYPGSPHLVDNAHKLRAGWWLDTHMGNPQKIKLIRRACEVAGIRYGTDLIISNLG